MIISSLDLPAFERSSGHRAVYVAQWWSTCQRAWGSRFWTPMCLQAISVPGGNDAGGTFGAWRPGVRKYSHARVAKTAIPSRGQPALDVTHRCPPEAAPTVHPAEGLPTVLCRALVKNLHSRRTNWSHNFNILTGLATWWEWNRLNIFVA